MFFSSDNFIPSPPLAPAVPPAIGAPNSELFSPDSFSTQLFSAELFNAESTRVGKTRPKSTGFFMRRKAGRAIVAGIDLAIDFATLGEYRVVLDAPTTDTADDAVADGIWATGIEWTTPDRSRATCSLPRARNRDRAKTRIRG